MCYTRIGLNSVQPESVISFLRNNEEKIRKYECLPLHGCRVERRENGVTLCLEKTKQDKSLFRYSWIRNKLFAINRKVQESWSSLLSNSSNIKKTRRR